MTDIHLPYDENALERIFHPQQIRDQAKRLYEYCRSGNGQFQLQEELLPKVVDYVNQVIDSRHPDGRIPYHSRLNHFQVGAVDRLARLEASLSGQDVFERVRAKIDLMMVSVLLDAGAGAQWQFFEPETGKVVSRSEGLAVASLDMFIRGGFSSEPRTKLQADGGGLLHLTKDRLQEGFQVSVGNPLVGVEGRLNLIHRLGRVVEENKEVFGGFYSRPGHLLDYLLRTFPDKIISAAELLQILLKALAPIWPERCLLGDFNLGDVWHHPALGSIDSWQSLQPFHKLTQWLEYSLLIPLEEAGFQINQLNGLTALPEYRNGGLLIDLGLLVPRDPEVMGKSHHPGSHLIVEWRALTIHYIDKIHRDLCDRRGLEPEQFSLVKALEGGTWWAGRRAAKEKRADGTPPLLIVSDGTVF